MFSSLVYSWIFGWPYAVGMVTQMCIHESGHAAMMRYYGIDFSPMVFIPGFGAMITMRDMPQDAYKAANIALAGPLAGAMAATALTGVGFLTDSQMCFALADFGYMVNLFNLLPIGSLDGGRVAGAVSKWTLVGGLAAGSGLLLSGIVSNPIFYLVMLMGSYTTYTRFTGEVVASGFYNIPAARKAQLSVMYIGLVGYLLAGMEVNDINRLLPQEIQADAPIKFGLDINLDDYE
ncbi:hypothetical protein CYMTET_9375 [Cymbomonas tetramitiformis]|uniref:Peptidase M50 domain-containing protein n=1 Tax=Cymbomonas tetramitiformis TaxID=36881 RepID=A0AAE0LFI6_9CHLO|nr:hypothetical protein CYMTET_9375 [Cymbomonas tetramitiformis]|eukprot:gene19280-23049_t